MPRDFGRHDRDFPPRRPGRGSFPRRPAQGPQPGRPRRPPGPPPPARAEGWDHVASWYDKLVGEEGSDYHRHVILPAALRMLAVGPGERVLDLCCGQGVFCRHLAQTPAADICGVDASRQLIAAARQHGGDARIRYVVADARRLSDEPTSRPLQAAFDATACLMAVQDVDDLAGLFRSLAWVLRPGGRAVIIMMHPCFRVPRQSGWGWDEEKKTQYRRIDRYASPMNVPIATHPGGSGGEYTVFHHRPLAQYVDALAAAGLAVVGCEELMSHHVSEPGGRSRGENRARDEIPLFLALKVEKIR